MKRLLPFLCLLVLGVGCATERHFTIRPGVSQVIKVESGDRWFFDLEENATTGYQWSYTCDDSDVEVSINHVAPKVKKGVCGAPGKARVMIRIHRGYDGPSAVTFRYQRPWEKDPAQKFTISMFKRTGDEAFWK